MKPLLLQTTASEQPNLAGQMPEEYTRGEVDDQPLSPVDEAKGRLDKLLGSRPAEKELVDVRFPVLCSFCVCAYTVAYFIRFLRRKT